MSKILLSKQLFLIDLTDNIAKFYTLELVSVGFNKIQLISSYGNMNGNGRSSLKAFEGEKAFFSSKKIFYSKLLDLKSQGYLEKEDLQDWFALFDERYLKTNISTLKEHIDIKKAEKKQKKNTTKTTCGLCHKKIKKETFDKINEWGRGEGNWDQDKNFIGYKKVLCIDCQIEYDIFKKKL